jgi:predicted Ser/Thr protein kinase
MIDLKKIQEELQKNFKANQLLLNFEEYLQLIAKNPIQQIRGSAGYSADMLDHFGTHNKKSFKIFDHKLVGNEGVQNQIYQALRAYSRLGMNHRLILLHGPNGSAKSTIISALMEGLEKYSHLPEGALYSFSWVFPVDRVIRGSLGIRGDDDRKSSPLKSYANLSEEEISCIIPSEMKDHPLLLLPIEVREQFFKDLDLPEKFAIPKRLKDGGLSHRDQAIFQALLTSYHGDYAQVLKHIRVERFYLSKVYRSGLVSIEPQMHVDAQFQLLTMNKSLSNLPASLQGINFFSVTGDLPDSNRGMIDYNDLLKRPIDAYKYLLTACETGKVNVGHSILHLDTVFIGSSNELQLDAFKEYPDFSSFKGRIELIQVPYLLELSQERKVYAPILKNIAGNKAVTPHTDWCIAYWGVLTRLQKPQRDNYSSELGAILDKFTPVDKLRLYDTGEVPVRLSNDERKLVRANLSEIKNEYRNIPYYEGRTGASAREMKSILIDAAQSHEFKTLSPLSVITEIRQFIGKTTEYDFLRQEMVDGYHDQEIFIETILDEYANIVDHEVRECLGLYDTKQWADFIKKYIVHLSSQLKKEKMKNPITGGYEEPDQSLLNEFESIVGAPQEPSQREQFRMNLITQIGAWTLDNPNEAVDYFRIFPDLKQKIEKHFYESQKTLLQKMNIAMKHFGSDHEDPNSEGMKLARQTIDNMQKKWGYTVDGAKEVIGFLMSKKY